MTDPAASLPHYRRYLASVSLSCPLAWLAVPVGIDGFGLLLEPVFLLFVTLIVMMLLGPLLSLSLLGARATARTPILVAPFVLIAYAIPPLLLYAATGIGPVEALRYVRAGQELLLILGLHVVLAWAPLAIAAARGCRHPSPPGGMPTS